MEKLASLVLATVILSGCATIVSGTHSTVEFISTPPGAQIAVEDVKKQTNVANCITPCSVELKKGDKYFSGKSYLVKATKEGYTPMQLELNSNFNWWYTGNILFGGLIGILIVDPLTGAMWRVPDLDIQMKQDEVKLAKEQDTGIPSSPSTTTALLSDPQAVTGGKDYTFKYMYLEFLGLGPFEAVVVNVEDIPGAPTYASKGLSGSDRQIVLRTNVGETIVIDRVPTSVDGTYCGTVNSSFPIKPGWSYTFPAALRSKSDCTEIR